MVRGIERRSIFLDHLDRDRFLERLALVLDGTGAAWPWALIPNHFHLLLKTGRDPLASVMRRLLTGYAVSFNRRHRRTGHLFQNRYKSILPGGCLSIGIGALYPPEPRAAGLVAGMDRRTGMLTAGTAPSWVGTSAPGRTRVLCCGVLGRGWDRQNRN
jgi:hypothetical protein